MGYDPLERDARRIGKIAFEPGHELHGAELTVALTASLDLGLDVLLLEQEGMKAEAVQTEFRALVRRWADECLISWNTVRRGVAVPADADGFMSQDVGYIRQVMRAWVQEVARPSDPLVSSAGASPPAESDATAA